MRRIFVLICLLALSGFSDNLPAASVIVSDGPDSIEITLYRNMAFIRDSRQVSIPEGYASLEFKGVSPGVIPETVNLRHSEDIELLEQYYSGYPLGSGAILSGFLGKEIKLVSYREDGRRSSAVDALLIEASPEPVYKIKDEIHIGHPGYPVLPYTSSLPALEPMLNFRIRSLKEHAQVLEAGYLTGDIGWQAGYTLVIEPGWVSGSLKCMALISNMSAAGFSRARVKLVAGDVRLDPFSPGRRPHAEVMMRAQDAPPRREELSDYHLYTLPRPVTLKGGRKHQVKLFEAAGISIAREYAVKGSRRFLMSRYQASREEVGVFISFLNSPEEFSGGPLPAGNVMVYAGDAEGNLQMIGAAPIDNTPSGGMVRLRTGNAFDITADRVQVSYRVTEEKVYETFWKIILNNAGQEDVTVSVVEELAGDWEIIESSHNYEKEDAFTVNFNVNLPAGGEAEVAYRARVRLP